MNNKNFVVNSSNKEMFYDANEALIKGNIQKDIYDNYKNYVPVEPIVRNEKEALLLFIQKSGFARHDLDLYLDTHPDCKHALELRNFYLKQYNDAILRYQEKYGPLCLEKESLKSFCWVKSPWPWEEK